METLSGFLPWLLAASLRASLAALVILGIQRMLSRRMPARWRYGLWLPFVLMLCLPALPGSPWSVERLWRAQETGKSVVAAGGLLPEAADELEAGAASPLKMDSGRKSWSAWEIAGLVWLAGFAGWAAAGAIGYRREMRRIRRGATGVSADLRELVEGAAREADLKKRPEIIQSRAVVSPAVTGPWRGKLLLPADFPEKLPSREAELILRHEMLHLKHRDSASDLLLWCLNAAHWFNPLIWFALVRLRSDREGARDAEVLADADARERAVYGGALLRLQLPCGARLFQAGFVGLVNGGGGMRRRIAGLAEHGRVSKPWHLAGVALTVLIQLTVGASAAPEKAASPKPVTKPAAPGATAAAAESPAIAKARTLTVDRVQFVNAEIDEVVGYLRRKSIEADSKEKDLAKKGVDMILRGGPQKAGATVTLDLSGASVYEVLSLSAEAVGLKVGPSTSPNAILIAAPETFPKVPAPAKPEAEGSAPVPSPAAAQWVVSRIQFANASITDAAAYIQQKSKQLDPAKKGINLVVSAEAAAAGKPITLDLRDVRVSDLVNIVTEIAGLSVEVKGSVYQLEVKGDTQ